MFGGALMKFGGKVADPGDRFLWRGCMFEGVSNMAMYMGYTNASWTSVARMRLLVLLYASWP